MGKINPADWDKYCTERVNNDGFITKPYAERKTADAQLDCVVYEIRLPKYTTNDDARKAFIRLANFLSRNIHCETVATLGLSNHAKWTPHRFEQGAKGGRAKKIFNEASVYRRQPHIHLNIAGDEAHKVAVKLYKNESRLYERKYGRPFPKVQKDVIRSKGGRNLSREYIQWQSTLYREFGDVDSFIQEHEKGG